MMLVRTQRVLKTNNKRGCKDADLVETNHHPALGQCNRNRGWKTTWNPSLESTGTWTSMIIIVVMEVHLP